MLHHRLWINREAINHIVLQSLWFIELWDKFNIWTSYFEARLFRAHDEYIHFRDFAFPFLLSFIPQGFDQKALDKFNPSKE